MAGFRRVFRSFPGYDEIRSIEGSNILEITPPANIQGAGVGTVLIVGEFERGPLETPTEVFGPSDFSTQFGDLGHQLTTNPYAGPVAVRSGGDELWNGNGWVWLRNKKFSGLVICRVDNSAGSVAFSRLSSLLGGEGPFTGVVTGDTIEFDRNGGTTVTATFTGTPGQLTGTAGTFPTLFTGGETLEVITREGAPSRVVTFTAADQTNANVRDRINARLGLTIADLSGGEIRLSSEVGGADGYIEIVGGTALATLGLPAAAVPQVQTFTVAAVSAGDYEIPITVNVGGVLTTYTIEGTRAAETTAQFRVILQAAADALAIPGLTWSSPAASQFRATADANVSFTVGTIVEPTPADITSTATTAAVLTVARGLGNVPDIASIAAADAVTVIDAVSGLGADINPDGLLRVTNSGTAVTGTLQVTGGTAYEEFGFDLTTISDADDSDDVTIPAGTRVQDSSATGTIWVTLEDVETGTTGGPYTALVRPWTDDDSAVASTSGNVTLILDTLSESFSVTNGSTITRLSGNQLDTRYIEAIDATLTESTAAVKANMIASARASANIASALKQNAIDATAAGLAARKAIVRPLLGTSRTDARATTGLGVGNVGRDERVFYVFPGCTMYVPEIASIGAAVGGLGFTDDGIIEVGADSFYASVRSILPPEENAGQRLTDTNAGDLKILSLEDDYNPEEGGYDLVLADYKSFKANGIIGLKRDRTVGWVFMSDVTSVDPALDPAKVEASRRFLADFVMDTIFSISVKYIKKLGTPGRKQALLSEIRSFLRDLQSPEAPESSRIRGYTVTDDTTAELDEQGVFVVNVNVRSYPHLKHLVFRTAVGTTVEIEEG